MGANTGSSTTPIGSRNSAPRSGADPAASVRRECGKLRRADRYRVHVIAKHLCGATVTRGTEHAALHFVSPTASVDADLHGSSCNLVDRTGYRRSDAQSSRPWTQPPSTAQILTAKVFRSWSGFATLLPSGRRANRDLEIVRGSDSALYGVRSVAHRLIPRCKSADRRSSFVCVRQVRNVIKRKSVVGRQHRGKTRQGQETRTQAAEAKEPSALGRQVHCRVDGGFARRWDADFPF